MPVRRRTRIGIGAFGNRRDPDEHGREVLRRILSQRLPLTEDAVFLCLWHQLRSRSGSLVLRNVRTSKGTGSLVYRFQPDVDLLEVTKTGKVIGYELKGAQRAGKGDIKWPMFYEGFDQALALLLNPLSHDKSKKHSIFDEVWLVHPKVTPSLHAGHYDAANTGMAEMIRRFAPVGFMTVSHTGIHIEVKAGANHTWTQN